MNFPNQNHKNSLPSLAKKYNRSLSTMKKWASDAGMSKTRAQYEKDAQKRREIAYNLRKQGLKFREIAEILNISINNAQQLVRRHKLTAE